MIYWFTGQPSSGKTTLANLLKNRLNIEYHLDGDELRALTLNKDYSITGRIKNVNHAHSIVKFLNKNNKDLVVSVVAPYIEQREELKEKLNEEIIEIYVHTSSVRSRDGYRCNYYQKPKDNYIDICTDSKSPEESLIELMFKIKEFKPKREKLKEGL